MTRIAPVNLAFNPKTLWFDAGDLEIAADDHVVVVTARGVEMGTMAGPVFEAGEDDLAQLKSALKGVKRVATEEDIARADELARKSLDAMATFREVAARHNENMHPVSVEFLFEGEKAVFYFEAEERLDFRDIVRELAAHFGVRIDMRQVGVRDEARMVGGIGHCGQELCCKRMGGEFCPVSIRMAKEQGLSLNPQKISGLCGRLMCCLRYEYEAYKEFHQRAPKQNSTVQTPAGPAKVASLNVPREIVDLKVEIDGKMKTFHVPLADMEPPEEEGARPKAVGEDAWERAVNPPLLESAAGLFLTSRFTGQDTLGDSRAVRRNNANVKNATGSTSMVSLSKKGADSHGRRRRSRGGRTEADAAPRTDTTRVRRRRSTTVSADGVKTVSNEADAPQDRTRTRTSRIRVNRSRGAAAERGAAARSEDVPAQRDVTSAFTTPGMPQGRPGQSSAPGLPAVRPGQKSSSLAQAREDAAPAEKEGSSAGGRRRRHRGGAGRRSRGGAGGAAGDGKGTQGEAPSQGKRADAGCHPGNAGAPGAAGRADGAAQAGASDRKEGSGRNRRRRHHSHKPKSAQGEGASHEA